MVIHALFEHGSKKFTEFHELALILNIKGLVVGLVKCQSTLFKLYTDQEAAFG